LNNISGSKTNKNIILRVAALLVLALLVLVVPFAVKVSAAPGPSDQAAPAGTEGVQGGAFEVTEYDLTAAVGKDHTYTVEEKISVNIPDQLQSVEFAIPSGNFRISDIEVENALYKAKTASEASKIVISDP
jgi:hypothetical protein